jgi:histone deacetylase 1/2
MVGALLLTQGQAYDNRYLLNLLLDHDFGLYENLSPNSLMMAPHAMKASATHDPDTPRLHEAMRGEHRDEFLAAMGKEIAELEAHGTWKIVRKESMPDGANLLPSTWALKIKRYPDGRMRKNKARFCVRGDKQIAGVDYFESYAPVASWSTVRMVMNLAIQRNWATRQVDFSNAFVQAELKEEVYVELPEMFRDEHNHGSTNGVVLKLNKSLYGLVQAPLSWYNHLQKGLNELDFKVSALDPGMYYGRGMILITYVDDTLFFGPDIKAIEKVISELEGLGYGLTREEGDETTAFAFLGVSILPDPVTKMLKLTQRGLILKVLAATGMSECNTKGSPALSTPLGTNADGPRRKETWHYASVIGMLMYLSSNAHPEIQFSVHQCARFTHCPRASHEEAVKHICRYLQGAKDEGLRFKPTDDLQLDCYVDADFAGLWNYESDQDPVCVKSRTGYVMTLGGCPIQWNSKLQTEIALSTTEAEYIALSQAMRELIPLRRLLLEIVTEMKLPGITDSVIKSTVFEDNNGAISTATAVKMTPRTKHIAVKYHFFKSYLHAGTGITIAKIDTNLQKADIFTKGLAPHKFAEIRKLLCDW